MDAFETMKAEGLSIPFILVTGSLGDERAVECLKEGVADYVLKDRLARLPVAIRLALEERRLAGAKSPSGRGVAKLGGELSFADPERALRNSPVER